MTVGKASGRRNDMVSKNVLGLGVWGTLGSAGWVGRVILVLRTFPESVWRSAQNLVGICLAGSLVKDGPLYIYRSKKIGEKTGCELPGDESWIYISYDKPWSNRLQNLSTKKLKWCF